MDKSENIALKHIEETNADKNGQQEEFCIRINEFSKERPIGISGLLRTKNGADFLSDCIDSSINALDELIIVYQESSDDTAKIVMEKQKQYPDKIMVYFYEPKVYSHNLTEEEYNNALNLPKNSIHLLSNYYNFALSKAKYKYAIKIDDDQIYFSDKFKEIMDLYRTEKKEKIFFVERLAFAYYKKLYKITSKHPKCLNSFTCHFLIPKFFIKNLVSYIKKKIQNDKRLTSYSGINLFEDKIPLGRWDTPDLLSPFNGTMDTLCFPVSSDTYYEPFYDKENNRIIERFHHSYSDNKNKEVFLIGFFWIHLKDMKKTVYEKKKDKYKGVCIDIDEFFKTNFFELEKKSKYRDFSYLRLMYYILFINDNNKIKYNLNKFLNSKK